MSWRALLVDFLQRPPLTSFHIPMPDRLEIIHVSDQRRSDPLHPLVIVGHVQVRPCRRRPRTSTDVDRRRAKHARPVLAPCRGRATSSLLEPGLRYVVGRVEVALDQSASSAPSPAPSRPPASRPAASVRDTMPGGRRTGSATARRPARHRAPTQPTVVVWRQFASQNVAEAPQNIAGYRGEFPMTTKHYVHLRGDAEHLSSVAISKAASMSTKAASAHDLMLQGRNTRKTPIRRAFPTLYSRERVIGAAELQRRHVAGDGVVGVARRRRQRRLRQDGGGDRDAAAVGVGIGLADRRRRVGGDAGHSACPGRRGRAFPSCGAGRR